MESASQQRTVLVTLPYLVVGGAQASVSRICRQLRQLGWTIVIITTERAAANEGNTRGWFVDVAEEIYELPRMPEAKSDWQGWVCSVICRLRVDVLWQVGSSELYELLPRIRTLFPELAVVDLLFNPGGHTAEHLAYRKYIGDAIVEHDAMRACLMEQGIAAADITVVPNGVDVEEYAPRPRMDWRSGEERASDDGRFVAAFIGRLSREKGPDLFLEIAAELAADPRMEFLVCGSGPMEAEVHDIAERLGIAARTHFADVVDTRECLPCCDVVVVSSRWDGRPNIVMESLAMGIPVVGSRVGGMAEMIPEGNGCGMCEPEDVPAFAAAVRKLAEENPQRREHYASMAREFAVKHFSMKRAGEAYARLFEQRIQERRKFAAIRRLWDGMSLKHLVKNAALVWHVWRSGEWQRVAGHFDRSYYRGAGGLLHYLFRGYREGRNPSAQFDTCYYLSLHTDVLRSGANPLLHYAAFGAAEGRPVKPSPRLGAG